MPPVIPIDVSPAVEQFNKFVQALNRESVKASYDIRRFPRFGKECKRRRKRIPEDYNYPTRSGIVNREFVTDDNDSNVCCISDFNGIRCLSNHVYLRLSPYLIRQAVKNGCPVILHPDATHKFICVFHWRQIKYSHPGKIWGDQEGDVPEDVTELEIVDMENDLDNDTFYESEEMLRKRRRYESSSSEESDEKEEDNEEKAEQEEEIPSSESELNSSSGSENDIDSDESDEEKHLLNTQVSSEESSDEPELSMNTRIRAKDYRRIRIAVLREELNNQNYSDMDTVSSDSDEEVEPEEGVNEKYKKRTSCNRMTSPVEPSSPPEVEQSTEYISEIELSSSGDEDEDVRIVETRKRKKNKAALEEKIRRGTTAEPQLDEDDEEEGGAEIETDEGDKSEESDVEDESNSEDTSEESESDEYDSDEEEEESYDENYSESDSEEEDNQNEIMDIMKHRYHPVDYESDDSRIEMSVSEESDSNDEKKDEGSDASIGGFNGVESSDFSSEDDSEEESESDDNMSDFAEGEIVPHPARAVIVIEGMAGMPVNCIRRHRKSQGLTTRATATKVSMLEGITRHYDQVVRNGESPIIEFLRSQKETKKTKRGRQDKD